MSLLLYLLAEARYCIYFAIAVVGIAAIALQGPSIDESKLQSFTGRVVREVSGSGLTLDLKSTGGNEPIRVNLRNYRMPQKRRPETIAETVTVQFAKPDDVVAITVNGQSYLSVAESIEKERLSNQGTYQFVSISALIVCALLIASLLAKWRLHTIAFASKS
jgi:hypothetical protein